MQNQIRSTTILCVRKNNQIAIGGDGQVSMGNTVMKNSAQKIRKIYNDKILTGFAGAAADAFTLLERFDLKLILIMEVYQEVLLKWQEIGD